MWALIFSGVACRFFARTKSATTKPMRTRFSACGRNTSSGMGALSASLMPRAFKSARAPSTMRSTSDCTLDLGKSNSALSTKACKAACLLRPIRRDLTSRSKLALISLRRPSTLASDTPSDLASSSVTSGKCAASSFFKVTRKSACLPATSLPW